MISVLDHIEYLTSKHDCVIVHGLGAFISRYSVKKNANGMPIGLSREISFNQSVAHSDGLLAHSISRREKITYELANLEIANYVNSLRSQISHEGEVPVGRVGYFSNTAENTLEFFPFPSRNVNNDFYGLSSISLKPLAVVEVTEEEKETIKTNIVPFTRKFMRVAASIALLIGMVLVLSTPVINNNSQDYANLNAFTLKSKDISEDRELLISIPAIESEASTIQEEVVSEETEVKLSEAPGNYGLVIASLPTEVLANKYIAENNLTNCAIFKSTTKYRVYIEKGTYDEMISLKETKYANSDAWVCRVK